MVDLETVFLSTVQKSHKNDNIVYLIWIDLCFNTEWTNKKLIRVIIIVVGNNAEGEK